MTTRYRNVRPTRGAGGRAVSSAGLVFLVAFLLAAQPAGQAPRSVWDGVFTDAQAERGRVSYSANCSSCHGPDLGGGESKSLRGERFWSDYKETTVDYVLGQISRNMPFSDDGSLAGSLAASTYADIVAHILQTNGFPAGKEDLTRDSSVGVQIIRKEGPGELPTGATGHIVGCLAKGTGGAWQLVKGADPVRVLSGQTPDPRRPLGTREYPLMFVITRLDKYVGYRMAATGKLIGEGGKGGIEVSTISPVSERCE
jgi:quinoprotein glucose dehydrogenase